MDIKVKVPMLVKAPFPSIVVHIIDETVMDGSRHGCKKRNALWKVDRQILLILLANYYCRFSNANAHTTVIEETKGPYFLMVRGLLKPAHGSHAVQEFFIP